MRLGVLDVGSNTVHLLVVDARRGGHPTPATSQKAELRLAEHLDAGGALTSEGSASLLKAVAEARDSLAESLQNLDHGVAALRARLVAKAAHTAKVAGAVAAVGAGVVGAARFWWVRTGKGLTD